VLKKLIEKDANPIKRNKIGFIQEDESEAL
jgi:hypothetical protein